MRKWAVAGSLLLCLAGVAWWQHRPLLARYCVHKLMQGDQENRGMWAARLAGLGDAALPHLVQLLRSAEPDAANTITAAVVAVTDCWPADGERLLLLAEELQAQFDSCSGTGQASALELLAAMLRRSNVAPVERIPNPIQEQSAPVRLCQAAGKLLQATAAISSLRPQALDLARELIDHVLPGQWLDICQEAALAGLKDKDAQTRAQAVHLVLHLARRTDAAAEVTLLAGIRHVLTDQEPLVRRAAVIALAPSRQAISDDDLLPVLHDSDPEVRRLAELALRSRGLEEGHLRLARLISDPSPGERLQVVDHLDRTSGLEPGVWLLRLSHDAVPAVRAAAVRAACCRPQVNLQERMRKIARDDPSPTVRQLARYYLDRPTAIHD